MFHFALMLASAAGFGALELVVRYMLHTNGPKRASDAAWRTAVDASSWCACLIHSAVITWGAVSAVAAPGDSSAAKWLSWVPLTMGYWMQVMSGRGVALGAGGCLALGWYA